MRLIPALLCVAGLAAAPVSAVAGPSADASTRSQLSERVEWSTARGRLGVLVIGLTPELRKHFGAPEDRGVLVARVEPSTPAAAAGVEVGDVIVKVHGEKIDAAPDVLSALTGVGAGESTKIELVRDGQARALDAKLTNPGLTDTSWPPRWLRGWGTPPGSHRAFAPPFDKLPWFPEWLRPHERAKAEHDSPEAPPFFERLRELFAPKTNLDQRT
ncbi:MAG: PDZ domain-containing protein [Kofleriaceae bacterium]